MTNFFLEEIINLLSSKKDLFFNLNNILFLFKARISNKFIFFAATYSKYNYIPMVKTVKKNDSLNYFFTENYINNFTIVNSKKFENISEILLKSLNLYTLMQPITDFSTISNRRTTFLIIRNNEKYELICNISGANHYLSGLDTIVTLNRRKVLEEVIENLNKKNIIAAGEIYFNSDGTINRFNDSSGGFNLSNHSYSKSQKKKIFQYYVKIMEKVGLPMDKFEPEILYSSINKGCCSCSLFLTCFNNKKNSEIKPLKLTPPKTERRLAQQKVKINTLLI